MSIFIPVWVLWVPVYYYVVGLVLYVPLVHWQSKFIYPRRTGLNVWRDLSMKRLFISLFIGSALWPWVIADCIGSEHRRYKRNKA